MKKTIHTKDAPNVVGPYSQAIIAGEFVYCSGQIGIDPQTNELVEGIENQTQQVLKNLQAVVKAANADWQNVVQTIIYVKRMSDYATVNEIYATYFETDPPARATVEVSQLPKNALVEIACTVYKK